MLVSVGLGLVLGFAVLPALWPDRAWTGLLAVLRGHPASILRAAAPLWLAGLSVGLAYRAGLFNLGAPGQMLAGGFAALFIGLRGPSVPSPLLCVAALACAALAGGLWGGLSGLFGANTAPAALLANAVGWYGVRFLVRMTPGAGGALGAPALTALPGAVVGLAALALVHVLLWHTRLGYELRAIGLNPMASHQAGLPVRRGRMTAMAWAGALAGLGGALAVLSSETGLQAETVESLALQGVAGLAVAWMGLAHPLGILLSGLGLAHLLAGMEAWAAGWEAPAQGVFLLSCLLYGTALFPWVRRAMERRRAPRPAVQALAVSPEPAMAEPPVPASTEAEPEESVPDAAEAPPAPPPAPSPIQPPDPAPEEPEKEGNDE